MLRDCNNAELRVALSSQMLPRRSSDLLCSEYACVTRSPAEITAEIESKASTDAASSLAVPVPSNQCTIPDSSSRDNAPSCGGNALHARRCELTKRLLQAQMSSSTILNDAGESQGSRKPLALPDLESASPDGAPKVEVGGAGVTLDHLGPLVCLARIIYVVQR